MIPPRVWTLLETVGSEDVYKFLGVDRDASLEELQAAVERKYETIHNQSARSEKARAGVALLGICKSAIFKSTERRKEYDEEAARRRGEPQAGPAQGGSTGQEGEAGSATASGTPNGDGRVVEQAIDAWRNILGSFRSAPAVLFECQSCGFQAPRRAFVQRDWWSYNPCPGCGTETPPRETTEPDELGNKCYFCKDGYFLGDYGWPRHCGNRHCGRQEGSFKCTRCNEGYVRKMLVDTTGSGSTSWEWGCPWCGRRIGRSSTKTMARGTVGCLVCVVVIFVVLPFVLESCARLIF